MVSNSTPFSYCLKRPQDFQCLPMCFQHLHPGCGHSIHFSLSLLGPCFALAAVVCYLVLTDATVACSSSDVMGTQHAIIQNNTCWNQCTTKMPVGSHTFSWPAVVPPCLLALGTHLEREFKKLLGGNWEQRSTVVPFPHMGIVSLANSQSHLNGCEVVTGASRRDLLMADIQTMCERLNSWLVKQAT